MTGEPKRFAFVVGVWPGVEQKMNECNIRNYSIYIHDDILFGYYEYVGDDLDGDMRRIQEDPLSQEWWTHTDPCQVRIADERVPGSLWQPIDEVWHLA